MKKNDKKKKQIKTTKQIQETKQEQRKKTIDSQCNGQKEEKEGGGGGKDSLVCVCARYVCINDREKQRKSNART